MFFRLADAKSAVQSSFDTNTYEYNVKARISCLFNIEHRPDPSLARQSGSGAAISLRRFGDTESHGFWGRSSSRFRILVVTTEILRSFSVDGRLPTTSSSASESLLASFGTQQRIAKLLPSEWFRALPCQSPFFESKPRSLQHRRRRALGDRHEQ